MLFLVIFFLILVGSFFKEGEGVFLEGRWRIFFMTFMFIGIVLIFLQALDWLAPFWDFMQDNWEMQWVSSLILIVFIVAFMYFVTRDSKPHTHKKEDK